MTESEKPSNPSQAALHDGGPTPETRHKRKVAMITLASIFGGIGLIWLIYYLIWGQFSVYTDDAYVGGNIVQLMSQVPGTVIEINTDDTQLVTEGQTLIKLDPADLEIALQRAKANLAQTVRKVRQYFENAKQARASLISRNADLLKAKLDLQRRLGLRGNRAVSREELQHYKTAVAVAQSRYDATLHHLQATLALVENSHLYTHPLVETAKANLKTAYLNLRRGTIVAPITGYVAKRSVQVGQQVSINTALLAIIPLREVWVDANYKESQLSDIRIDQPVTLYADAYDDITYHGKIVGLNAGTGAAFSLLPPQNATGNWIKIVQRLPVRVGLDPDELKKYPLQIGLSMRVTTNVHNIKGHRLAHAPLQKPPLITNVYAEQLAEVDPLITHILHANSPDMYLPTMQL